MPNAAKIGALEGGINAFKSQYSNLLIAEWPKNTHENPQIYDGSQSARYGRF
jgi:hypothetical protein